LLPAAAHHHVHRIEHDDATTSAALRARPHATAAGADGIAKTPNRSLPWEMTLLGELYAHGYGIASDDAKAAEWYRLAADRGDREAMFALAINISSYGGCCDERHAGQPGYQYFEARACKHREERDDKKRVPRSIVEGCASQSDSTMHLQPSPVLEARLSRGRSRRAHNWPLVKQLSRNVGARQIVAPNPDRRGCARYCQALRLISDHSAED